MEAAEEEVECEAPVCPAWERNRVSNLARFGHATTCEGAGRNLQICKIRQMLLPRLMIIRPKNYEERYKCVGGDEQAENGEGEGREEPGGCVAG